MQYHLMMTDGDDPTTLDNWWIMICARIWSKIVNYKKEKYFRIRFAFVENLFVFNLFVEQ